MYDRYVDQPGILLDDYDVSEIFETNLQKHYMHVSDTKPVWLSPSSDPFTCTLRVIILLSFPCKEGNILLFSFAKKKICLNCE